MRADTIKKLSGEKIQKRRNALNISQAVFADWVGLSRASIANIERGAQGIDLAQLFLFAEKLKTTPEMLLPDFSLDPKDKLSSEVKSVVEDLIRVAKYG